MIKKWYEWMFAAPKEQSWAGVIGWWEVRRIPYNIIVGAIGVISLILFYSFLNLSGELKPGEDAIEPLALLAAPVLINIAYTFGWVAELFLYGVWRQRSTALGPAFLKLGLSFSICVVMLPSAIWFVIWICAKLIRGLG